jgi:hypothetical protein
MTDRQEDLFRKPLLREIAPGRYVPTHPEAHEIPDTLLCHVVPVGNGEYTIQPFREDWMRCSGKNLAKIGMERSIDTLKRLAKAGFVEMVPVAPGTYLLNLTSWYNHLRRGASAQADEEEFWEPGRGNLEAYRETGGWM